MEVDDGIDDHALTVTPIAEFKPARFPVELGLPPADESLFQDAKTAVRQEFRDCSKRKCLRCHQLNVIAERDRGTIYAIHVGGFVEFDWTWEGATAFRPHALSEDGDCPIEMADFEESPVDEVSYWSPNRESGNRELEEALNDQPRRTVVQCAY